MSEILIALCFPHEELNIDHIYKKEQLLQAKTCNFNGQQGKLKVKSRNENIIF